MTIARAVKCRRPTETPLELAVAPFEQFDRLQAWLWSSHILDCRCHPAKIRKNPGSAVLFLGSRTVGQITLISCKHVIVA
jgi:hypothetical protein